MTDRAMSFVEPYLTAELGEKVGTKRDNQGIKTLL
jgi:hypothetical protein